MSLLELVLILFVFCVCIILDWFCSCWLRLFGMTKGAAKNILALSEYIHYSLSDFDGLKNFCASNYCLNLKPQNLFSAFISNILFIRNSIHHFLSLGLLYKVPSKISLEGLLSAANGQKFGFGVSSRSTCRLFG